MVTIVPILVMIIMLKIKKVQVDIYKDYWYKPGISKTFEE